MSEGTRHIEDRAEVLSQLSGESAISVVRQAFDAFAHRDLLALVALTDPEIELFAPTAALANEGRCYRGHDGIARYLHDVERVWVRLEVSPEKYREVGNHVIAIGTVRAEARDGLEIENPVVWVWELRRGKLCWGCVYDEASESFTGASGSVTTTLPAVPTLADQAPPPVRAG